MTRIPSDRPPTHPGEMLLEEFLIPLGLTQKDLAWAIHVPYQRINEIINHRRGITPSTALRLAKFFSTSAELWMNLQQCWDLYHAQQIEKDNLKTIQPLTTLENVGWSPGFFEKTSGSWVGEPLVREPQPEAQERELFESKGENL